MWWQHKTTTESKTDKYIHYAEEHIINNELDQASEALRKALDSNPTYEQTKEINTLMDKVVELKYEPYTPVEKEEEPLTEEDKIYVYVTKSGSKYHRPGCSYLKKSAIPMTLRKAKDKGYTSCSRCKP